MWVLALFAVLSSVGWLFAADAMLIRESFVKNSRECFVAQIANFPADTNTIFLGTSRVRRGIDLELAEELSGGAIINPVNLGRQGYSSARNMAVLLDVLRINPRIEHVFFEIEPDLELDSVSSEAYFRMSTQTAFLARQDYGHLFEATKPMPFLERVRVFFDIELTKLRTSAYLLLSGEIVQTLKARSAGPQLRCWMPAFDKPPIVRRVEAERREMERLYGDFVKAERRLVRPRTNFERVEYNVASVVQDILRQRGISLTISRLPGGFVPPLSQNSIDRLRARWPGFVSPNAELRHQLWDGGFRDGSHMTQQGRAAYTRWLVGEMLEHAD